MDPGPWCLFFPPHDFFAPPISIYSEPLVKNRHRSTEPLAAGDTTATEQERQYGRKMLAAPLLNTTVCFRGIALPAAAIAPLRLAACDRAVGTQRAHPDAVDRAFHTHLEQTILPYCLGDSLDAARAALVAKSWARGVQGWFGAGHWRKLFGLEPYFPTPAEAAAALSVLKAIKRPSPELQAAVGIKYRLTIVDNDDIPPSKFTLFRVGKLTGLPFTFLWR